MPISKYIPTAFVSTLPSSAIDGQEIYYQASGVMAASGITWHLRYNASSSSAYKWEFVGGTKMTGFRAADETGGIAVNTWGGINANDPSLTVPLPGDYIIENFGNITINGSPISTWIGVKVGNTEATADATDNLVGIATITSAGYWHSIYVSGRRTISANDATSRTITQRYYHSAGSTWTVNRRNAGVSAIPVRVG